MSEPEKPSPTETNAAAHVATPDSSVAAPAAPAAVPSAKPSAGWRHFVMAKWPVGRRARIAVAAGLIGAVGLIAGVAAWPKTVAPTAHDVAADPVPDADVAASRRVRPACDLLEGALDEDATLPAEVTPSSRPVADVALSRPAAELAIAAAPKRPAVGLSAGLMDVADAPAEPSSASRPASRPAPVDPTEFAAAEAAYGKGEWKNSRDAALRFLMRPGPLGDRGDALIGRAHVRLALALARIRREEIGASDDSLPEPVVDFPESRP